MLAQDVGEIALGTRLVRLRVREHLLGCSEKGLAGRGTLDVIRQREGEESWEFAGVAAVWHQAALGIGEVFFDVVVVPFDEDV